jgi:hypothetical protein
MSNVAPGWLVAACLVCIGWQAGNASGQVPRSSAGQLPPAVLAHPVVAAAWPPAYETETDLGTLQAELGEAQARALASRKQAAALTAAGRQAEAQAANLQADEAARIAQAILARIAVVRGSAAPSRPPLPAPTGGSIGKGLEPPAPHEERRAARPVAVPPVPVVAVTAAAPAPSPPAPAPAAVADNPNATLADDSAQIDSLVQGSAGVSAPTAAKVGESFIVYLRVSPDKLATLLATLQADHPENGTQKGQGIRLTPRMTATASGEGFEVSPKEGQVQAVSSTDTTEWQWQVTPTAAGSHTLTVMLTGNLIVQGQDTPRTFLLANQPIDVAVSPVGFFRQYWQWLVTTIAIPVIGALWAVFRKRVDENATPGPARSRRGGRAG